MGEKQIDPKFEGMLTALRFLRERRELTAHARIVPDVYAYGAARHYLAHPHPEYPHGRTPEERAYRVEIAAALICRATGENPGDVIRLAPEDQSDLVERAEGLAHPPADQPDPSADNARNGNEH